MPSANGTSATFLPETLVGETLQFVAQKRMMRSVATIAMFISLMVSWSATAAEPLVIEIWPREVPDESGGIGSGRFRMSPALDRKQVEGTEPTQMITDVTKPTITIYRPAKEKKTGAAMLICAGGGYWKIY